MTCEEHRGRFPGLRERQRLPVHCVRDEREAVRFWQGRCVRPVQARNGRREWHAAAAAPSAGETPLALHACRLDAQGEEGLLWTTY